MRPDELPHIGLVGDTYTITVPGEATDGRYCVIDMHIPPGGGPPPHRHDFEETFILLEGGMQATFRGQKSTVRAGETLHIPANAPHQFHNSSATPPPPLTEHEEAAFIAKVTALAPKCRTELLRKA